jgi:hypothetical protein
LQPFPTLFSGYGRLIDWYTFSKGSNRQTMNVPSVLRRHFLMKMR